MTKATASMRKRKAKSNAVKETNAVAADFLLGDAASLAAQPDAYVSRCCQSAVVLQSH
jgi:hypothetical protein